MFDFILWGTCIGGTCDQSKYTLYIVSLGTVVVAEVEHPVHQLIQSSPITVEIRFQNWRVEWSTETLIFEGCTVIA